MNESVKRLEEKIAFLEHHVTQQDKAMLELAEEIAALRREIKALHERPGGGNAAGGVSDEGDPMRDERPPHY